MGRMIFDWLKLLDVYRNRGLLLHLKQAYITILLSRLSIKC